MNYRNIVFLRENGSSFILFIFSYFHRISFLGTSYGNHHKLGYLNNGNWLLPLLEGHKSKIEVSASPYSLQKPCGKIYPDFFHLPMALGIFGLCAISNLFFTWPFFCVLIFSSSYKAVFIGYKDHLNNSGWSNFKILN